MADTVTSNYNLVKPEIGGSTNTWGTKLSGNFDTIDSQMKNNANAASAAQSTADAALPKAGGTMTGYLTLNGAPTNDLHAATKKYADDKFVPKAGGTMTGLLTLSAAPTSDLHAATKKYVDDNLAAGVAGVASVNGLTGAVTITAGSINAAEATHTHSLSALTQGTAKSGQVVAWNGSEWAPASLPPSTVTATQINDALNGKALAVGAFTATSVTTTGNVTLDLGDKVQWGTTTGPYISGVTGGGMTVNFAGGSYKFNWNTDGNVVLYSSTNTVLWQTNTSTSDANLKDVIGNNTDAMSKLKDLRVVDYTWKPDCVLADGGKTHTGFIAQEVAPIIPDAAKATTITQENGQPATTWVVFPDRIVPHLVKAVQELSAKVEALEARLGA